MGTPLDEIRCVRADIECRVKALLGTLGIPVVDEHDDPPR
jgi:hypothetical protein